MPAPSKDADARRRFPTHSLHGSLLALVLAFAIFRFFIQGKSTRSSSLSVDHVGYRTRAAVPAGPGDLGEVDVG